MLKSIDSEIHTYTSSTDLSYRFFENTRIIPAAKT
jgi:hypothetical protein